MAEEVPTSSGVLVRLPERRQSPWVVLARRLSAALAILVGTVLLVYLDREGYGDSADGAVSFLDSVYYATVTLSTTGYGDITPRTGTARAINAFVITPARIIFLVLLIGTTLEVLASEGRAQLRAASWRKRMKDHVIVIGYGTKGRSAVATLLRDNGDHSAVVVVDRDDLAREEAAADGLAVVPGDATRADVLRRALVERAKTVIVTTDRDDTNILATLTARRLNPTVHLVVCVRERDNMPLARQSGADSVIPSADSVGQLMGLSTVSPHLGAVMEDLLTYGDGLEVAERGVLGTEVGLRPDALPDRVLAVIRGGSLMHWFDPGLGSIERGDRVVVVRPAEEKPWAPRPGTHGERASDEDDD